MLGSVQISRAAESRKTLLGQKRQALSETRKALSFPSKLEHHNLKTSLCKLENSCPGLLLLFVFSCEIKYGHRVLFWSRTETVTLDWLQHKLPFVSLELIQPAELFPFSKSKWGQMQQRSSAAQIILRLTFSQTTYLIINDLKGVKCELQDMFVNLARRSTLNSAPTTATALNSDTHF